MLHDFVWEFFLYSLEFLCILDSFIVDLDMICIINISIYIVVFMESIPRLVSNALAFGCLSILLH